MHIAARVWIKRVVSQAKEVYSSYAVQPADAAGDFWGKGQLGGAIGSYNFMLIKQ